MTLPRRWREPPPRSDVYVDEEGRIHGLDGLVDQVAGALAKHAMPVLERDGALTDRIGQAVGRSVSETVAPWVALGLAGVAVYLIARHYEGQP